MGLESECETVKSCITQVFSVAVVRHHDQGRYRREEFEFI